MASVPNFPSEINVGVAQIAAADTSTAKTVLTAGASGTKVTGLMVTSDDSSDRVVQIGITRSATFYLLGAVTVTDLSGTDGTNVSVNLLNATSIPGLPIDADGQRYLLLESGDTLQAKTTTTVTADKTVHLVAIGKDL